MNLSTISKLESITKEVLGEYFMQEKLYISNSFHDIDWSSKFRISIYYSYYDGGRYKNMLCRCSKIKKLICRCNPEICEENHESYKLNKKYTGRRKELSVKLQKILKELANSKVDSDNDVNQVYFRIWIEDIEIPIELQKIRSSLIERCDRYSSLGKSMQNRIMSLIVSQVGLERSEEAMKDLRKLYASISLDNLNNDAQEYMQKVLNLFNLSKIKYDAEWKGYHIQQKF